MRNEVGTRYQVPKQALTPIAQKIMAETEGETLNSVFQELADWEHQLKALDEAAPIEWEEPSP